MYRLQVKFKGEWRWGLNDYNSEAEANARVAELAKVGIKSRVRKAAELFS